MENIKILVVDDESRMRKLVKDFLTREGYAVVEAGDGVEAMDEVTLVGQDGDQRISVEEVASAAGSFNYEFVCGISKRVPRVYMQHGKMKKAVEYLEK